MYFMIHLLTFVINVAISSHGINCQRYLIKDIFRLSAALPESAFKSLSSIGLLQCSRECLSRLRCRGLTFYYATLTCDLSENDLMTSGDHFSEYISANKSDLQVLDMLIMKSCSGHSCSINASCVCLSGDKYACVSPQNVSVYESNVVYCGSLEDLPGSSVMTPGYPKHVGATVTVSCQEGFVAEGDPMVTCLSDGQWSTPSLTCTSNVADECGGLPDIPGSNAIPAEHPRDLGATVTFSCQEGFVAEGDPVTTCLTDGQWSTPTLTCVSCGPDFEYDETLNFCYKVIKDNPLPQSEATSHCVSLGGKLAKLDTRQKVDTLSSILLVQGVPDCFIDGKDITEEGVWIYQDGRVVDISLFVEDAPDMDTEDNCLMLDTHLEGIFYSECDDVELFLCEKP